MGNLGFHASAAVTSATLIALLVINLLFPEYPLERRLWLLVVAVFGCTACAIFPRD